MTGDDQAETAQPRDELVASTEALHGRTASMSEQESNEPDREPHTGSG